MRTPSPAPRSSRRTGRTTSAAWTSCGRSAASTRACPAACTCTSAAARRSRRCTRRCWAPPMGDDAEVEARLSELDELLARVEQLPGPAGELALEAVAAVVEIYGA